MSRRRNISRTLLFTLKLPKNTKRAKIRFDIGSPNADTAKQIIVEEIEFYEDKPCI